MMSPFTARTRIRPCPLPNVAVPRTNLRQAANRQLLGELVNSNAYNQQQARRVLIERGQAIRPELETWTKSQTSESALIEALTCPELALK